VTAATKSDTEYLIPLKTNGYSQLQHVIRNINSKQMNLK